MEHWRWSYGTSGVKGSDDVTVRFGRAYGMDVYDPTVGTEPVMRAGTVDSLKLTLSNHPLVIVIRPK